MIVRELKQDPSLIHTFDFFNDYKDTRAWLRHNAPHLVVMLDKHYKIWLANYRRKQQCSS